MWPLDIPTISQKSPDSPLHIPNDTAVGKFAWR